MLRDCQYSLWNMFFKDFTHNSIHSLALSPQLSSLPKLFLHQSFINLIQKDSKNVWVYLWICDANTFLCCNSIHIARAVLYSSWVAAVDFLMYLEESILFSLTLELLEKRAYLLLLLKLWNDSFTWNLPSKCCVCPHIEYNMLATLQKSSWALLSVVANFWLFNINCFHLSFPSILYGLIIANKSITSPQNFKLKARIIINHLSLRYTVYTEST